MRILLVEPHDVLAARLEYALRRGDGDVEVTRVTTPVECLVRMADGGIDAVVMSRMIGSTRAEDLVAGGGTLFGSCPVVLVTPARSAEAVAAGVRMNAADVLSRREAMEGHALSRAIHAARAAAHDEPLDRRAANRRVLEPARPAETDPITGLPGRRCLERLLAGREIRRDRRRNLGCVVFDVDLREHAGGDEDMARSMAGLVRSAMPRDAMALRVDDLGIVVLSHWPTIAHGWRWMESMRALVAAHAFSDACGRVITTTASLGFSMTAPENFSEDTVALARDAMLMARSQGGNRACTWQMVAAQRLAELLGGTGATIEDRRQRFVSGLRGTLGATQVEHVTTHSEAVRDTADALARAVGVSAEQQQRVRHAAILHDIGKCVIPDELLAKPAALSYLERAIIDEHAECGAEIGLSLGVDERTAECVRKHHVHFAGPLAEAIEHGPAPIEANIVAAADALATITTGRPYQARRSMDEALFELLRGRGSQFDPVVVDAAVRTRGGTLRCAA